MTVSTRATPKSSALVAIALVVVVHSGCAARRTASTLAQRRSMPTAQTTLPTLETTDRSLSSALTALAIRPSAPAERRVAQQYLELGVLDAASDHFARACALDPTDAVSYDGLARIWRDWGFPALGLGDATRAVFYAPSWAPAHNTLGTLLTELGRRVEARRAYERALALDPQAAYVWSNLCYLDLLDGVANQAIAECQAALAIDPAFEPARRNMARALAGDRP